MNQMEINQAYSRGLAKGMSLGIESGIAHIDYLECYYPGLNRHAVVYDPLQKDFTINSAGKVTGRKLAEEPLDKYMRELVEEMRTGLQTAGIDRETHISNVLKKFSDRKFKDRAWWGYVSDAEMNDILLGIQEYYLPHTAMLNSGLSDAFMFGKYGKVLTSAASLAEARGKVADLGLSSFEKAGIEYARKSANIFWDKAISRETDAAAVRILQHNRDAATGILAKNTPKSWRSLTSDIYHSIVKNSSVVLRDLERITLTELADTQNNSILMSGLEDGEEFFFVHVQPTACKKCKNMYLDADGKPKKFRIRDMLGQPRDVNWNKKKGEPLVPQMPVLHPFCFCTSSY
ncbi:MAG: hypothetical protein GY866_24090 [Proteobacteria bacterium]|nr:hypothetical protein [Pseudomonadota bacterium]